MIAVLALLVATLERVPALRFRAAPLLRPHAGTDVVYLLTGFGAGGVLAGAWVRRATAWSTAWTGADALWPSVPFPVQAALALVALDLGNYLVHWALHRWDVLWRFHEAHHSSRRLDWLATFRSHLVEQLLRRALAPLALVAAGVPAPAVGVAAAVYLAWAILNHANLRLPLGVLEGVFVTPRLHRLHHVPATTERNLGTVFTWWDRLRGTLVLADPDPETPFGLPRGRATYPQDWLGQLAAPWTRRA
jgi:sterol desaturase/sphingolipid hydroxylase (fatty acid hydroxylase superfamily)